MTPDPVHVWLVDTDLPGPVLAVLAALLDPGERERAAGLPDRAAWGRFVAAHGALRSIVGQWLGAPPEQLRWQPGAHGKPELAGRWIGAQVSLSHSGSLAMVAVTGRRPVGVDIQELAGVRLDPVRLAERYFPAPEAASVAAAGGPVRRADRLARLWTRKEACVKAAGGRLMQGLRLPVTGPPGPGSGRMVRDPAGPLPGPFLVRDVPAPGGFRAAVALAGADRYRVVRHLWVAPPSPGEQPRPGHASLSERPVLARKTSSRLGR